MGESDPKETKQHAAPALPRQIALRVSAAGEYAGFIMVPIFTLPGLAREFQPSVLDGGGKCRSPTARRDVSAGSHGTVARKTAIGRAMDTEFPAVAVPVPATRPP